MERLNKEEQNLVTIQGLYLFAGSLVSIFITTFLFKYGGIKASLIFWGIHYANLFLWYLLSGFTLRKVSAAFLIRLSLFSSGIFFLLLFLLKEKSLNFIVPLAIVSGFSSGNFWPAYNLNQYALPRKEKRLNFFGIQNAFTNILGALAPFIGGAIIATGGKFLNLFPDSGYIILFFVVYLIYIISAIYVGKLPKNKIPDFNFKQFFNNKRTERWKMVLGLWTLRGLYDITLSVVGGILIFLIVKKELILGLTQTLSAILGAVVSILAIRLLHKTFRYFWVGAIGLAFGVAIFALLQNFTGLLFFIILTSCSAPLLENWRFIVYHHALDENDGEKEDKYFLQIEREGVLDICRALSCLCVYFLVQTGNEIQFARFWLYVLLVFPIMSGFLLDMYGDLKKN